MLAQIGARFATVDAVARDACRTWLTLAMLMIPLAAGGIASGHAAPLPGNARDPADPAAKVAGAGYRSTIAPYTRMRPAVPEPWREQNQRVAPSPTPDRSVR